MNNLTYITIFNIIILMGIALMMAITTTFIFNKFIKKGDKND